MLGKEWLAKGVNIEVPQLLRNFQSIRIGILKIKNQTRLTTQIPTTLNVSLKQLGLLHLFQSPPDWIYL